MSMHQVLEVTRANQQLQKGDAQRLDDSILNGIDGQALSNLCPAPQAICKIGMIMCMSLGRDFELVGAGQVAPPEINNPNSFRATMVQIAGAARDAFQEANGNMHELGLQMGTVPDHMKNSVRMLLDPEMKPSQLTKYMGNELASLAQVGDKCLQLATDTHAHFQNVGKLFQRTQELVVAKQGDSQKFAEQARENRRLQEIRIQASEAAKRKSKDEFDKLEKNLKEAQNSMKEAMDAKPSMGDMIGAGFADAACKLIKDAGPALTQAGMAYMTGGTSLMMAQANGALAGVAAAGQQPQGVAPAPIGAPTAAGGADQRVQQANQAAAGVVDLLHSLTTSVTGTLMQQATEAVDKIQIGKQLDIVKQQASRIAAESESTMRDGQLGVDVSIFSKELEQVLGHAKNAVEQGEDQVKKQALCQVQDLLKKAQVLAIKKASILPSATLPPTHPCSSQGGTEAGNGDGGIAEQMVSGWKFQVQQTREVLAQAEKRRRVAYTRYNEVSSRSHTILTICVESSAPLEAATASPSGASASL